jgi:hypothetical protein
MTRKLMTMYRLLKIEGVAPARVTELKRSHDYREMEAQRDTLLAASLSNAGPASLAKLRYGVSPA